MKWLDIAGAPGSGKSTLVDGLWPPRCIPVRQDPEPLSWHSFLNCTRLLLKQVENHPSFPACQSMVKRSFAKMATVNAIQSEKIYIQTGFAQRGLGIGWRLNEPYDICDYFAKMPVSLGVVLLTASTEVIQQRNRDRGKDRSHMVPLMEKPLAIAAEVLTLRGVPLLKLDTTLPVQENVDSIIDFAKRIVGDTDTETTRYRCEGGIF
jgi:hypothetical protein